SPHERPVEVEAPYVAEMVRQEMIARYGGDVLTRGYHVTTTIDPTLQAAAATATRDGLETYDHRHGWNKVEQHFDLAEDEDAATAAARLRRIPAQNDLLPAVVMRSGNGSIDVVLADASTLTLDAGDSKWTGRAPSALAKRGDGVRVRRIETPVKKKDNDAGDVDKDNSDGDEAAVAPEVKVTWQLDQLPRAQTALVSLDPENGALLALTGGFSFAGSKFNRATQARRQPGS